VDCSLRVAITRTAGYVLGAVTQRKSYLGSSTTQNNKMTKILHTAQATIPRLNINRSVESIGSQTHVRLVRQHLYLLPLLRLLAPLQMGQPGTPLAINQRRVSLEYVHAHI
jgi:hypothetical protein